MFCFRVALLLLRLLARFAVFLGQTRFLSLAFALNDAVDLAPYSQKSDNMYIAKVHFVVDHLVKKKPASSSSSKGAKVRLSAQTST